MKKKYMITKGNHERESERNRRKEIKKEPRAE